MVASCLEIKGSQPLTFTRGLSKCIAVFGLGEPKLQVEANKEQVKKNSQNCETLLLKIMTKIYDRFLPQQKGAQLEGWKQQALCTSTLCFAYSITHWLGDKNKRGNTLSNPRRRRWKESSLHSFLGMYVHTAYLQIEALKKIGHATVSNSYKHSEAFYCTIQSFKNKSCVIGSFIVLLHCEVHWRCFSNW